MRDYTPEAARAFLSTLQRCRIVCRDDRVRTVLDEMVDTEEGLAEEFAGREDALDPSIPLLFYEGGHWSEQLNVPFEFIHDDSKTIERWKDRFIMVERVADPDAPVQPPRRMFAGIEALLPTGLQRITFGQSDRDGRLQLADVLAGATVHVTGALSGVRGPDPFARDLDRLGLAELMVRWVGPDFRPADVAALR